MLKSYFIIALRNLRINKTYTLLNIMGLSMGMTGAILIFLFLQFHWKTDRHHADADRIYRVVLNLILDEGTEYGTDSSLPFAVSMGHDYAGIEKAGSIRKLPDATFSSGYGGGVKRFIEKENTVFADQGFMDMFVFDADGGRSVMTEPNTVVISEKVAEKYFGTAEATGKILRLNNAHDLKVAEVVKNQEHPSDLSYDIYVSLPTLKKVDPSYELDNYNWLSSKNATFIKLSGPDQMMATEKQIKLNGKKYYGDISKYYDHKLQPLADVHFDERYDGKIRRSILWILGGVGCFLILIACINFINMATAQALKRSKEIGVRKVLGGTQSQLFWQFMNETALLAFFSAVFASILTFGLLPVLNNWTHTKAFHIGLLFQWELLVFGILTIGVVVLMAGFYPAVIVSGFNPIAALKNRSGTQLAGGIGMRRPLITIQLAIAQILIISTIVLVLQLRFFQNANLGFDQNSVITLSLPKNDTEFKIRNALKNELLQYPDVKSVSFQYEAPTSSMGYGGSVRFDNRKEWEKFVIRDRFGDEDYIDTYKMKLLAGRSSSPRDSVIEFVVNEEFMRKVGIRTPEAVLGKQLEDGNTGLKGEIVGVVKSFHLKSLQEVVEPCAIFAHPKLYKEVAVKLSTRNIQSSVSNIQSAWQKVYPDEVFNYQFVDEQIARFYQKEQQLTTLIRTFSIVAILICCLGLYGMISFMVTQKRKEIGIRKVLGAGVDSIILLFGREFVLLVMVGFVIAAPVAWYIMNNWLNNFAYHISLHWWILATGGFAIMIITLTTVSFKVVRAALMNPVKSIGVE